MRKGLIFILIFLLCFTAYGLAEPAAAEPPQRVAALSGSFADIWLLAGGSLACTTQDAWEERELPLTDVINVGSLKSPSAELLLEANIDYALLTSTLEGQRALGETLSAAGVKTTFYEVETFSDYLHMLKDCTDLTGNTEAYETYGAAVEQQVNEIIARCKGKPSPTVLLIRAYSTGAKAKNSSNNMTGAMLKDLGCQNIADRDGSLLEDLSLEAILAADPDFIFVTTMGADDEALAKLAESLQSSPAWGTLSAVKDGRFHVLPKELFHYKPNARWAESYQMLSELLYGHE